MTLAEMRTLLRKYIGNPSVANKPEADLTEVLNMAYRQIASKFRFQTVRDRYTISTSLATTDYALQSTDLVVYEVWNKTTGNELRKYGMHQLPQIDATTLEPTDRGEPVAWYRDGNTLQIYPSPDAVYVLELVVKFRPGLLALDADVPVIEDLWHEGIVMLARWYHWDMTQDFPKAQQAMNNYKLWLADKPNEFDEENEALDQPVEVGGMGHRRPPIRGVRRGTTSSGQFADGSFFADGGS